MKSPRTTLLTVALLALVACEGTGPDSAPEASMESGDAHVRLPETNMRDVMQAKLVHSHALLEGIALQNYRQVELNALSLTALSEDSDWQVHSTLAYGALSDEFRQVTTALAEDARAHDGQAVAEDYVRMVQSCLRCHAYLRREGLYREVPGAVSFSSDPRGGPPPLSRGGRAKRQG